MSADPPEPARRVIAAGDPPARGSAPCGSCRALPASFFAIACTTVLTDFLRTGKWTSLFWLVSQGIAVFLFVLRKDAVSLSHRP